MLYDELGRIDRDKVAGYITGLQKADGSFMGDKWGSAFLPLSAFGTPLVIIRLLNLSFKKLSFVI